MSLLIWLPLNGDLENLGLSDTSAISTANILFSDNGKIGKCISGYTGYFSVPSMAEKKQMSVAYWIKVSTATATNWLDAFRWFSTDGLTTYRSRNEFYTNTTLTGFWYQGGSISGKPYTVGTWQHHVFIIDYETGITKFYINGSLIGSQTNADTTHYLTGNNFMIGENGLDTSHNDFRLYDHCLSEKEVKEISKGLVAHYPLNDFIANKNLFKNTADLIQDNRGSADGSRKEYMYFNVGDGYLDIPSDTIVTISFDLEMDVKTGPNIYFQIYNTNNKGPKYFAGRNLQSELTGYQAGDKISGRYSVTTTIIDRESSLTTNYIEFYSTYGSSNFFKISNLKMELGSVATPWIPNEADSLYSDMGLDETVVYDTSGYKNHGTLSPNSPVIDMDSVRYSSCMRFNGSNNYIDLNKATWLPTDQITVSMWCYMDTWGNTRPISCTESGGFNFEQGTGGGFRFPVYKTGSSYIYGTPVKKWTDYTPGWHLITGTFDGYVSRIYIDGEFDSASADNSTKALIGYNKNAKLFIGCEASTANPSTPYFNGKISDVRIYATALSADDIRDLYRVSSSVDNHGNTYSYEINEI